MTINAWATDQGSMYALPMERAIPEDPYTQEYVLQWSIAKQQLVYAPNAANNPAQGIYDPNLDYPPNTIGGFLEQLGSTETELSGGAMIGFRQNNVGALSRNMQAKARESVSLLDETSTVDGVTNVSSAVQLAVSLVGTTQRSIDLVGNSAYAPTLVNNYGVPFKNGALLRDSTLGASWKEQVNTYNEQANPVMYSQESLAAFRLAQTNGVANNIFVFGDSTVEMNGAYVPKAEGMIAQALNDAGLNWCAVVNRGVSGTSWSDLNAIPDLAATTKLIIIKYGINDAAKGNAFLTFVNDMRAKLAAIRAAVNGGYDKVSILLMMPNSIYHPSANQDWMWCEKIKQSMIQAAKDYDCAVLDAYALTQNSRRAPGMWLDQIAPDNGGIHMTPDSSKWIWRYAFATYVFGNGTWSIIKSNNFWNRGGSVPGFTAFPTDQPQLYQMGLSIDAATLANGWPADGTLNTYRSGSSGTGGSVRQELTTLEVVPRIFVRTGTGTTWTQWTTARTAVLGGIGFQNAWTNYGLGYRTAGYLVRTDGFVQLLGAIAGGTLTNPAFTLPANARPTSADTWTVPGSVNGLGTASVTVFADGRVVVNATTGGLNTFVSLSSIAFPYAG